MPLTDDASAAFDEVDKQLRSRASRLDRRLRKGNATDEDATRAELGRVAAAQQYFQSLRAELTGNA